MRLNLNIVLLVGTLMCVGIAIFYTYRFTEQPLTPTEDWRGTFEEVRKFSGDSVPYNEKSGRQREEEAAAARRTQAISAATNTNVVSAECKVPLSDNDYVLVDCDNGYTSTVYVINTETQMVTEEFADAFTYVHPFASSDMALILEPFGNPEEGGWRYRFRQYNSGEENSIIIEGSEIQYPNTYRPYYEGMVGMRPLRADTKSLTVGVYQERHDRAMDNDLVGTKTIYIGTKSFASDDLMVP